jgi:Helix-turn-helix domain
MGWSMDAGHRARAAAGNETADPGAIVRSVRLAQRLTLAQVGRRAGYSAAQVSRYERGITPPDQHHRAATVR